MVLPVESESTSFAFNESLESAARKLHFAQMRSTILLAAENAATAGSWFLLGNGILVVCSRLCNLSPLPGKCCFFVILIGMSVYLLTKVLSAYKARPSLAEAAERLDLAIHSHNLIATSYELSGIERTSEFSQRAFVDGLHLLETAKESQPVLPERSFHLTTFSMLLLAVGMLLLTACWIWNTPPGKIALGDNSVQQPVSIFSAQKLLQDWKPDPALPRVPIIAAQQQTSHPPSSDMATHQNEHSENTSTSKAGSSQQTLSFPGSADGKPNSDGPGPANATRTAMNTKQSDQSSSPASKANAASDSADAGAGQPVTGSASGNGSGAAAKSPPGNSGSGAGNDSPSSTAESQSGTGAGLKAQSKGGGSGDVGGEPVSNGKGKGTGQNSLKKSRGVAPEYLGGLDPDSLTAPRLPGPEERSREQISPLQGSGIPASDANAEQRIGPESLISHCDVPADSRSVVSDYFKALHQSTK